MGGGEKEGVERQNDREIVGGRVGEIELERRRCEGETERERQREEERNEQRPGLTKEP